MVYILRDNRAWSGMELRRKRRARLMKRYRHQIAPKMIGLPIREATDEFQRTYLAAMLRMHDGNVSHVAEFIGMERSALHRKMKVLRVRKAEGCAR